MISDPATREVARLFTLGYEALLQVLTRFFTHTDESDEQLGLLIGAAFGLMTGVLAPLGEALTRLPAGPDHPGRTVGPAFEMYYQMGNFVPGRTRRGRCSANGSPCWPAGPRPRPGSTARPPRSAPRRSAPPGSRRSSPARYLKPCTPAPADRPSRPIHPADHPTQAGARPPGNYVAVSAIHT